MRHARTALVLIVAFGCGTAGAQQVYHWTDQQGRVHVSDTPPPAGAKDVRIQAGPAPAGSADAPEPYVLQIARQNAPVTLYSSPNCGLCAEPRKLLNARGVPFREVSVSNEQQLDELKQAVGADVVPSIVVGAAAQKGYDEATYQRMLDEGGYPRTGVLAPRNQAAPAAAAPAAKAPAEAKPPAEEAPPAGPYAPGARTPPARPQK